MSKHDERNGGPMFVRRLLAVAAVAVGLVTVPAATSMADPTGGCSYPPNRPVLTVDVSPQWIRHGDSATVTGQFSQNGCPIVGATIAVEDQLMVHDQPRGHWTVFAWLHTDSNGQFSTTASPPHDVLIRAVSRVSSNFPTTFSNYVPLHVVVDVSMLGYRHHSCVLQFKGDDDPAKGGGRTVLVQDRGPRNHYNGWTTLWTSTTDGHGHYNTSHAVSCRATYNISVEITGDSDVHNGRSRTIFTIHPVS